MNKEQEKLAFPHGGKQENGENQLSLMGENQNSAKISFPSWGKTRKQRKSAFSHGGKQKNSKKRFSPARENEITARTDFPPRGKAKKC